MLTKQDIIRKYLGVPYKHRGRSLDGVDCYGLVALVYKDLGTALPDFEYEERWYENGKNYYIDNYYELWKKVDSLQDWDCILFKSRAGVINHVGILVGENKFLHCYEKSLTEVSDLTRKYWSNSVYGYFRYLWG